MADDEEGGLFAVSYELSDQLESVAIGEAQSGDDQIRGSLFEREQEIDFGHVPRGMQDGPARVRQNRGDRVRLVSPFDDNPRGALRRDALIGDLRDDFRAREIGQCVAHAETLDNIPATTSSQIPLTSANEIGLINNPLKPAPSMRAFSSGML